MDRLTHQVAGAIELTRRIGGVGRRADDVLTGLEGSLPRVDRGRACIDDTLTDIHHGLGRVAHRVEAEERHHGDAGSDEEDEESTHCLRRYVGDSWDGNSPRAFRGTSYDQGVEIASGPWDSSQITAFLDETVIPIRIASAGRTSPLVQSLWFVQDDGALWCCTQAEAVLTRRLTANPRCGFEVSGDLPPYRGVRGTARAEILPARAADMLPRLIHRYLGDTPVPLADWLMSRLDREVAIRLHSMRVTSFDFSSRMT